MMKKSGKRTSVGLKVLTNCIKIEMFEHIERDNRVELVCMSSRHRRQICLSC